MKTKNDHFIRSIDDEAWKNIKILSIKLEMPIGQLIEFLLNEYQKNNENKAA